MERRRRTAYLVLVVSLLICVYCNRMNGGSISSAERIARDRIRKAGVKRMEETHYLYLADSLLDSNFDKRYVYEYDQNGNTIREENYFWDFNGGTRFLSRIVEFFAYDSNNLLISEKEFLHNDSVEASETHFVYGSDRNLVADILFSSPSSGSEIIGERFYEYDSLQRLHKITLYGPHRITEGPKHGLIFQSFKWAQYDSSGLKRVWHSSLSDTYSDTEFIFQPLDGGFFEKKEGEYTKYDSLGFTTEWRGRFSWLKSSKINHLNENQLLEDQIILNENDKKVAKAVFNYEYFH